MPPLSMRSWPKNEKCVHSFLSVSTNAEATAWDEDQWGDLIALHRRSDRFAAWQRPDGSVVGGASVWIVTATNPGPAA